MRLLFLYGPPAAGKLTVAREIAAATGLRVFHNHLTIELAHEVFPERDKAFGELVSRLRLDAFEAAAQAEVSMISTFVYAAEPDDDAFLAQIVEIVERHGGRCDCVGLLPSREALRARVSEPSRRAFTKIGDWPLLESLLDASDLTTPIEGSLTIDNSDLSPGETARRIVEHFELAP